MSYCVNCGVELDASLKECPLCNTPVINPREIPYSRAVSPFPREKGQVEMVKKKDAGILLSTVVVATAVVCGLLNLLVFSGKPWSLIIIGACVLLWVIMIPVVIYSRQPIYVSLLFDGVAMAAYLYMITYLTGSNRWFAGLALPITALATVIVEIFTVCVRKLPRSFLTVALYCFTAIGVMSIGLEILIDRYLHDHISLSWSAVVLTVCVIVDITIVTLLSRKRLRNAVRRRLHF